MTFDVQCVNEECEKYHVVKEINVPYSEFDEQVCEECKQKIQRVWSGRGGSIGIRTSDGYKG